NGLVYINSDDGVLRAYNAATGALVWSHTTNVAASPTIVNGVVYIGGGPLLALDASTGALLWQKPVGEATALAIANGNGFGCCPLTAFSLANPGPAIWAANCGTEGTSGTPATANGVVYISTGGGRLCAFDAATGALEWSAIPNGEGVCSELAVANGRV